MVFNNCALFISDDQYCEFLTPSFALSGTAISDDEHPPTLSSMSSSELDALLSEMEKDIRSADRDLREIDALEKRGVAGAGKLAGESVSRDANRYDSECSMSTEHEALKPRLEALVTAHEQDLLKERELENRISALLEKHATKVFGLFHYPHSHCLSDTFTDRCSIRAICCME